MSYYLAINSKDGYSCHYSDLKNFLHRRMLCEKCLRWSSRSNTSVIGLSIMKLNTKDYKFVFCCTIIYLKDVKCQFRSFSIKKKLYELMDTGKTHFYTHFKDERPEKVLVKKKQIEWIKEINPEIYLEVGG